jgi:hypothetical protein
VSSTFNNPLGQSLERCPGKWQLKHNFFSTCSRWSASGSRGTGVRGACQRGPVQLVHDYRGKVRGELFENDPERGPWA